MYEVELNLQCSIEIIFIEIILEIVNLKETYVRSIYQQFLTTHIAFRIADLTHIVS